MNAWGRPLLSTPRNYRRSDSSQQTTGDGWPHGRPADRVTRIEASSSRQTKHGNGVRSLLFRIGRMIANFEPAKKRIFLRFIKILKFHVNTFKLPNYASHPFTKPASRKNSPRLVTCDRRFSMQSFTWRRRGEKCLAHAILLLSALLLPLPQSPVLRFLLARLLQALPTVRDQGSQVLGVWIDAANAAV